MTNDKTKPTPKAEKKEDIFSVIEDSVSSFRLKLKQKISDLFQPEPAHHNTVEAPPSETEKQVYSIFNKLASITTLGILPKLQVKLHSAFELARQNEVGTPHDEKIDHATILKEKLDSIAKYGVIDFLKAEIDRDFNLEHADHNVMKAPPANNSSYKPVKAK